MALLHTLEAHKIKFQETTVLVSNDGDKLLQLREAQVIEAEKERSKLNWLGFAIVGAAFTFNPEATTNPLAIIGSFIVVTNSFISYLAQAHQKKFNIAAYENGILEIKSAYDPYADAYYNFISRISEEGEKEVINKYADFLEKMNSRNILKPKKTPWAFPFYLYFAFYYLGVSLLGIGLILTAINSEKVVEVQGTVFMEMK